MSVRRATGRDAAALHILAAETFGLACPPHTTDEAKAEFIATVLSEQRFDEYLADPARTILVDERADAYPSAGAYPSADAYPSPDAYPFADAHPSAGAAPTLVGYTMLVSGEPTDSDVSAAVSHRPTIELSKFYVLASAHGAGVAAGLMAASLYEARARGAAGIWLGVNEENARAIRFYGKHGFEKVGRKRFLVGGRLEDDFVLERGLEPTGS